ncbi:MAG TPA: hypothetical protein VGH38_22045 [Bryobacteraceae bacterium]|jgi:hypothetical protein
MNQSLFAPLLNLVARGVPFTAVDGQAFLRLPVPSSRGFYILPIRGPAFRHWFFHEFYVQYNSLPTPRDFQAIQHHLEAEANCNEPNQRLSVFRRVGCRGNNRLPDQILLDLGNPESRFVEISPDGWRVTAGTNALLQTSLSTCPLPPPALPDPDSPPPLERLRASLNLASRADWLRCLAWLMAALRPSGPYPVLVLQGPPGSGKSLAASILRSLVDPSSAALTPVPSSVRDLVTLARHNWVLAFDHISTLSPPLTDALCRLASGLGLTTREAAGPGHEPLQQFLRRPILLTVTDRWSCPPDLADRVLTVNLPSLAGGGARSEDSILGDLDPAWPVILGALCSAIGTALARLPQMSATPSGRCVTALAWAMAASPALDCTEQEIEQAFSLLPAPHPMAEAVRNLMEQRRTWTGSASELLEILGPLVSCRTPKGVSQQLRQCMLTLADSGIELRFRRLRQGTRVIHLSVDPGDASSEKDLEDASPFSDEPPQVTETEELTAA